MSCGVVDGVEERGVVDGLEELLRIQRGLPHQQRDQDLELSSVERPACICEVTVGPRVGAGRQAAWSFRKICNNPHLAVSVTLHTLFTPGRLRHRPQVDEVHLEHALLGQHKGMGVHAGENLGGGDRAGSSS